MSLRTKKIIVFFIIIALIAGWWISIAGVGSVKNVKESLKYGLDINGGVYVVMEAKTDAKGSELASLMDQTRAVINNRVNEMGVAEATVTIEGTNRLRIEMPGVKDAAEAIKVIGQTAKLQFVLADGTVVLDGTNVKNVGVRASGASYVLDLSFDTEGGNKFEEATKKAYNGEVTPTLEGVAANEIAIVLDGKIIVHPMVKSVISGGSCEMSGNYTLQEANNTRALIMGGALPVTLEEINSSVQSANVGVDALNKSIVAGALGFAIIFCLMIFAYGVLGFLACLSLMLYVAMFLWSMVGFNVVLTLPGIAALILSIGMAVDSNIIIFDRIKEEIASGKTIRVAVDAGFKNAIATVWDAQLTTLIAAVILYLVGTTAVKGFALTLGIGIFLSLLTAVVITQLFVSLLASSPKLAKNTFFGVKADGTPKRVINTQFKFVKHRKIYYIISASIIIIGIGCMIFRGMNYGIDFTGGTKIQVDLGKQIEIEEIKNNISSFDLNPSIIYSGETNSEVIITTKKALDNDARGEVVAKLKEAYGITDDKVLASEQFGPSVGDELKNNAFLAIILASIAMLIYIIFKFKSWKYGISALIGIIHDVLMVISFYAIFGYTVNNPFIAAILTLVGYSINDTIVIFDRIRENKKLYPKENNENNIDKSLSQTMNRTILTSATTLTVMIPLALMVSSAIGEFIIPLIVGVIVGCLSSIFLCSPLYYELCKSEDTSKYAKSVAQKTKKGKE